MIRHLRTQISTHRSRRAPPSDERSQTIVAALGGTSTDINDAGMLFAAVLVAVGPVAVACAFFADTYAQGLGAGVIES